MDKPVRNKMNLDKGLKRSAGKPACCVSKGEDNSNTVSLPNQVAKTKGFEQRVQYYATKAYGAQTNIGDKYHNLKEVIFIAIADYILFPEKKAYQSDPIIPDKEPFAARFFYLLPRFVSGFDHSTFSPDGFGDGYSNSPNHLSLSVIPPEPDKFFCERQLGRTLLKLSCGNAHRCH